MCLACQYVSLINIVITFIRPVGLNQVEAELAKAMLSIPATKGFEIGSGFAGVKLRGSQHNDRQGKKEMDMVKEAVCVGRRN